MPFTPNTLIATQRGQIVVQDLRPGDKVKTRDNGLQEFRRIGRKNISGRDLLDAPHLRPVLIKKDSFGTGMPLRDMMVTPNHRICTLNKRANLFIPSKSGLVAAKNLVDHQNIQPVECVATQFIHLRFAKHQIISANGVWLESFACEDMSLGGIGNSQRNEIFELFPEIKGFKKAAPAQDAAANAPTYSERLKFWKAS